MRIALATHRPALFGALLAVALIVTLPMRLALAWLDAGSTGLAAREVNGSVWDARLSDAELGEVPLGDVGAALSALDLLFGRARIALRGKGLDGIRGSLVVSRHSAGIAGMSGSLAVGPRLAPIPITRLDLTGVTARFANGACDHADGRVTALLATDVADLALPTSLSGDVRCDGKALLVPLASGLDGIDLRLQPSGRYRAIVRFHPQGPAAIHAAEALGMRAGADGFGLTMEGRF